MLIGGDSSDGSGGSEGSSGEVQVVLVTHRSLAQQARARIWRVVARWEVLARAACHHDRQVRCVDERVSVLRRLALVRVVPVGRPMLRTSRAVRLLQLTWRLVPYRRGLVRVAWAQR